MRLIKRLTVAGVEVPLVSEDIRLDADRPGRAVFQVRATAPLAGEVAFAIGWHFEQGLTRFFTGDIERCEAVDGAQQRMFCREVSARLDASMPVAMRHPTLCEVVTFYAERTGLHAIVPDRPYATTRIPYFGGLGSGFHGVASLGEVFGIPDYTWGAQGDGRLFVGSWADSRWPARPVELPRELFIRSASTGSRVVAVPGLRPGAVLNGERIQALRLAGHEMEITCKRP